MTRTRKRAASRREKSENPSFPSLENRRMFILPPKLAEVAPSTKLTFELKEYAGACFLLCNGRYVGTIFGLDLPESKDFSEAQLAYVERHLEEDLILAAMNTVRFSFPHAAALTSRTPLQAKSWRTVQKLEIENLHRIMQKGVKKRGVRVGPPPGIGRRTAEKVRQTNDNHRARIETAVVKLYGRTDNVDLYRKNAVAKNIGIAPQTLNVWLKSGNWDFEQFVTSVLRRKR